MIQAAGVRDQDEALMLARAGVTHIGLPLRLDYHTPDVDDEGARRIVAAVGEWNRRMAEWERRAAGLDDGGLAGGPGREPQGGAPHPDMPATDRKPEDDRTTQEPDRNPVGAEAEVGQERERNGAATCLGSKGAAVCPGQKDSISEPEQGKPVPAANADSPAPGAERAAQDSCSECAQHPSVGSFRPVQTILITYQERAIDVALLAQSLGVDGVQLHGWFSPDEAEELRRVMPGLTIFKSLVVGRDEVHRQVELYAPHVDVFLTDTFDPQRGASGATGMTHDWAISRELVERSPLPVMLAGGLTPENVADAVHAVRPAGVDAHTGLEDAGGAKDPHSVALFVRRAFEAAR